jgi:hypothetical protein
LGRRNTDSSGSKCCSGFLLGGAVQLDHPKHIGSVGDLPILGTLTRAVKRVALLLVVLVAACDSGTVPTPTTAPPGPTTTTTIVNDTCDRLASDMAVWLEMLIEVLDDTPAQVVADPEAWPEALVALQQQGGPLDARGAAMECDPGALQAEAFRLADLDPDSATSRYLMGLLGLDE